MKWGCTGVCSGAVQVCVVVRSGGVQVCVVVRSGGVQVCEVGVYRCVQSSIG